MLVIKEKKRLQNLKVKALCLTTVEIIQMQQAKDFRSTLFRKPQTFN